MGHGYHCVNVLYIFSESGRMIAFTFVIGYVDVQVSAVCVQQDPVIANMNWTVLVKALFECWQFVIASLSILVATYDQM